MRPCWTCRLTSYHAPAASPPACAQRHLGTRAASPQEGGGEPCAVCPGRLEKTQGKGHTRQVPCAGHTPSPGSARGDLTVTPLAAILCVAVLKGEKGACWACLEVLGQKCVAQAEARGLPQVKPEWGLGLCILCKHQKVFSLWGRLLEPCVGEQGEQGGRCSVAREWTRAGLGGSWQSCSVAGVSPGTEPLSGRG